MSFEVVQFDLAIKADHFAAQPARAPTYVPPRQEVMSVGSTHEAIWSCGGVVEEEQEKIPLDGVFDLHVRETADRQRLTAIKIL